MDLGVVLQCNPPASRVVELCRQAENYGFSHAWTFDSHLLWEEPYVIYSAILAATRNVVVGPMVTNPATRDWTVTASTYATLNEMYGNRTLCGIGRGDRVCVNRRPNTRGRCANPIAVIRGLANGEEVEVQGQPPAVPLEPPLVPSTVWVAAYGPRVPPAAHR